MGGCQEAQHGVFAVLALGEGRGGGGGGITAVVHEIESERCGGTGRSGTEGECGLNVPSGGPGRSRACSPAQERASMRVSERAECIARKASAQNDTGQAARSPQSTGLATKTHSNNFV